MVMRETASHATKGITMHAQSSIQFRFANKFAAGLTAFVLSLVLISGTVSVPTAEARTTYVGELA